MDICIFDIEADGLLEDATKIHCMSCNVITEDRCSYQFSFVDYDHMREFLMDNQHLFLIGHKIITYDIPMLEKFLEIKIINVRADTLGLSQYLYPNRLKHGLEEWGDDLGIAKPQIADWTNLSVQEYIYRCETDVQINTLLWQLQWSYLMNIYVTEEEVLRLVGYLTFKLECAREQEEVKCRIDKDKVIENLHYLTSEKQRRIDVLKQVMPKVPQYRIAERPKVFTKKDGSHSSHAIKWLELLKENNLPEYHVGSVRVLKGYEEPKPTSHPQLKEWLFSMGWSPLNLKTVKDEDGTIRRIPQIANEEGDDVCQSVKDLYEIKPELESIEGLFIIQHRMGILQGFLDSADSKNFIKSEINGFTNTLRFQHKKPIVNLPQVPKKYWKEVRECIIYPQEGYELCGSDMSGLEDSTKRHYMFYYDPEYVKQMMTKGFDPHIDIAVLANLLTYEEGEAHKLYDQTKGKGGVSHKATRLKAKKVNFAAVYGAGAPKLSLTAHVSLAEAKKLHKTYWDRNWSVKQIAEDTYHKTVNDQMWLYNPVSRFWYSLRFEKDKFSTLNQGTGVYCFDMWVRYVRSRGIRIAFQYHDEIVFPVRIEDKSKTTESLRYAIDSVNNDLKLNVTLNISIDYGKTYADIH